MTTTTPGLTAATPNGQGVATPARLPSPLRRRQPSLAIAGLMLVVVCAAIAATLFVRAQDTISVLVAARDIPAGTQLSSDDLGVAQIAGSGLSAIPAANIASVSGKTAITQIPKGSLLSAKMVTAQPVPGKGQLALGVAMRPGTLPGQNLEPGRYVTIFRVPTAQEKPADLTDTPVVLVERALVLSVEPGQASGDTELVLVVDQTIAGALSRIAVAGGISVAVLPVGS